MARMIKVDKNEAREKYSYLAYPKALDRVFQTMVIQEAKKYGIENVKDLMKNVLMECVVHYERNHHYIEARDWAAANWQKNRYSDLNATNVEEKRKTDYQKVLADELKHIEEERARVSKLLEKIPV